MIIYQVSKSYFQGLNATTRRCIEMMYILYIQWQHRGYSFFRFFFYSTPEFSMQLKCDLGQGSVLITGGT